MGYRQLWQVLDGKHDLVTGRALAVTASRQLAKRQLTWLRSLSNAHWLDSQARDNRSRVEALIEQFTTGADAQRA